MMVKICGITMNGDAIAAAEAGADALGFNFYPKSPRYLTAEQAAELGRDLAPEILRVGVFVDASPDEVRETARVARLDVVQLHGQENPADYAPLRVWKAFRVAEGWTPAQVDLASAEAFLIDGPAPGTGASFDWSIARDLPFRAILAGGLGPDNVAEAVRQTRPWGVDACSKLESAPGRKDHERMRRFIRNAVSG